MSWIRIVFAVCALLLAACSSYDRKWKAARVARPMADPMVGAYSGTWTSARYKGTGGKLWCIVTNQRPGEYLAEFRATWHGVFASCHSVLLRTKGTPLRGTGTRRFEGEAAISMWIGSGTYRCEGEMVPGKVVDCTGQLMSAYAPRTLVPARITARYDATYDSGTLKLGK